MSYWGYSVCVGGEARQWHAEHGVRQIEFHLGRHHAHPNRHLFAGGYEGRAAELLVACRDAPSWLAPSYSLVVHEPQPLQYLMTLFHPVACTAGDAALNQLWGECFATSPRLARRGGGSARAGDEVA